MRTAQGTRLLEYSIPVGSALVIELIPDLAPRVHVQTVRSCLNGGHAYCQDKLKLIAYTSDSS